MTRQGFEALTWHDPCARMTRIIRECRYWWEDLAKFLDHDGINPSDMVNIAWLWRKDDTHKLWISRGTILKD